MPPLTKRWHGIPKQNNLMPGAALWWFPAFPLCNLWVFLGWRGVYYGKNNNPYPPFRFCVAHSPTKWLFCFKRRFSRLLSTRRKRNRHTDRNEKRRELLLRFSPPGQVSLKQAPAGHYFQFLKISSRALLTTFSSCFSTSACTAFSAAASSCFLFW